MKLLLDENFIATFAARTASTVSGIHPYCADGSRIGQRPGCVGAGRRGRFDDRDQGADFVELAVLRGAPPKVIRLAIGNVPNDVVHACLIAHVAAISRFATSDEAILELDLVKG